MSDSDHIVCSGDQALRLESIGSRDTNSPVLCCPGTEMATTVSYGSGAGARASLVEWNICYLLHVMPCWVFLYLHPLCSELRRPCRAPQTGGGGSIQQQTLLPLPPDLIQPTFCCLLAEDTCLRASMTSIVDASRPLRTPCILQWS